MQERPVNLLTWRWYLLVVAAYLIGLISVGTALRYNVGFPLDDSWIHQEIARNLVQYRTFGFTPGVTSSGSSSALWTLILSLNYLLFPTHSPVFFPLILNSLLIALSGVLMWRMAVLDGLPVLYALALSMLPALCGNYLWLVFIGMEHILFVTLSLAAIFLWFRDGESRPAGARSEDSFRTSLLAGITLGALGMTRPEGLALSVLLFALYKWCGRTLADVFRAAGIALLFLVPSFVINLKTSGALLPLTMRGRRFLYLGSDKLHIGRSTVRQLTMDTYQKVIQHNFFHTTGGWAIIFVVLAFYGCVVLLRRFPNRTAVLVLWATLNYASYCFSLPATGHGGRYQPFVLVLFGPLLAVALFDLMQIAHRFLGSHRSAVLEPAQAVVLAVIGLVTAATLPRWNVALRDGIYDIGHYLQMAYWLDDHYPRGTKIGVFDIGAIAYFGHMDVIDLGGLVDPHYLPYLLSGRVPQYLEEKGAQYVILPVDVNDYHVAEQLRLSHNPGLRLEEIHVEGTRFDLWKSGVLYNQDGAQYQILYRIVPVTPESSQALPIAPAKVLLPN